MPNFRHQALFEEFLAIDEPPTDPDPSDDWIRGKHHLALLRANAQEDDLLLQALTPQTLITAALVSSDQLADVDYPDLLSWSCNLDTPAATYRHTMGEDEVRIERDLFFSKSRTLRNAVRLVFDSTIEGPHGVRYPELLQEYVHLTGVHWRLEERAYCRIDTNGSVEPVVSANVETKTSFVTFRREDLELYLAATDRILVRLFDLHLRPFGVFDATTPEEETYGIGTATFYKQRVIPGRAGVMRGVQILRPKRSRSAVFGEEISKRSDDHRRHVDFLVWDHRHRRHATVSTDASTTTNYFEAACNSLPYEVSAAFFRPEVLSKYKSDGEKYQIRSRSISCRGGWLLRSLDVNEAGQVHAYICDLRHLPFSEQQYWASFNEPRKAGISERALASDFLVKPFPNQGPAAPVLAIVGRWEQSSLDWWRLRDPRLPGLVNAPLTGSEDDWADAVLNLSKLVIEGFVTKALRARLRERSVDFGKHERSIVLLERLLAATAGDREFRLSGLREVQKIRTQAKAHSGGTEGATLGKAAAREYGGYAAHFAVLCRKVAKELEKIESELSSG